MAIMANNTNTLGGQSDDENEPNNETDDHPIDKEVESNRAEWKEKRAQVVGNPDLGYTWGDYMNVNPSGTRILFQNVNGIPAKEKYAKLHLICEEANLQEIEILCLAETNLDWNSGTNISKCTTMVRKHFKQSKIATSSSRMKIARYKYYQPGGVMSISGTKWASRTRIKSDETGLGRWTELEISGKNKRKVSVITAYQVCKDSIETTGNYTAFRQQWTLLSEQRNGTDHDPRKQFQKDLVERISTLKNAGHEIILAIDANDSLQVANSELGTWIAKTGLIDTLTWMHGTEGEPHTHSRGQHRIDYIFTSETLTEYVIKSGVLPLHEFCQSDHRALFIDIDLQAYLGNLKPQDMNKASRGIRSDDPLAVKLYQDQITRKLQETEIEAIIDEIDREIDECNGIVGEDIHEKIERVDKTFTDMKLKAEEASKPKHSFPWSPSLRKAHHGKIFWSLWLSQIKLKKDLSLQRIRYAEDENIEYIFHIEGTTLVNFIKHKLRNSQKGLDKVRERATEYRIKFLETQAEMYANEGRMKVASILKMIKNREQRQISFDKLKFILKKTKSGGLDFAIDDENGEEVRIQDPDELNERIIRQNIKHFSQADRTPPCQEPIKSLLGPTGTSEACEKILEGAFDISQLDTDEAMKTILQHLKRDNEQTISDEINEFEMINGHKKWSEATTTSPSGLHLGHEKAILRFRLKQEETASMEQRDPLYLRIFKIKAKLVNWAIKYGHTYQRWTKVVNAMIEKIQGRPLINKLRVIHLIESDFNLMIGILWGRRLVKHGEEICAYNDGQGGSRPDRMTQELLLQKHLTYSVWRMARINGASFDNDAKSCFDRIVMPLASLIAQNLGMPKNCCEIFCNTLRSMKYHIKTSHGISDNFYSSTEAYTIHGPGQGGRGSPSVWLGISSFIMKLMEKKSEGSILHNPFDNTRSIQRITGFVDDVTHWYSTKLGTHESANQIVEKMKTIAQWWEQLLNATGGKLELAKCFFYLVYWEFNDEGVPRLLKSEECEGTITLKDSEDKSNYNIPQKQCDEPHKSLGIWEQPDGGYDHEFSMKLEKAKSFGRRIAAANVTRFDAKICYFTMYVPSMNYSAAVSTVSEYQAEQIQGSVSQIFLSKMGFNRYLPNAMKYGPPALGGVGLRHLFFDHGTEKCKFIIRLLRINRPASKILRIHLDWAQRIAGTSWPILEFPEKIIRYLHEEKWIETLREFLSKSKLRLKIQRQNNPSPLRLNDRNLMDHLHDTQHGIIPSTKFSIKEEMQINRCRLYLKVTFLSEVCNAKGDKILESALLCDNNAISITTDAWPNQPRPGPNSRNTWRRFLRTFCNLDTIILEHPLGPWSHNKTTRKDGYSWYYNTSNNLVYREIDGVWRRMQYSSKRTYNEVIQHTEEAIDPVEIQWNNMIPADCVAHNDRHSKIQWSRREANPTSAQPIISWETYVENLKEWETQLIKHTEFLTNKDCFKETLESENITITVVSDGGCELFTNRGSFGWVIAENTKVIIQGKGLVPGEPMSSHRAEAFGKLSWIVFLKQFATFHRIKIKCRIDSYCDNMTIVKKTGLNNAMESSAAATTPNFDVTKAISVVQRELKEIAPQISDTRHVKAHQDQKKKYNLSVEEKLNVKADKIASETLEDTEIEHQDYEVPFYEAGIVKDGKIQYSGESALLRWRHSEFQIQEYYCNKFKWDFRTMYQVNWAGLRMARDRLSPGKLTFSIKQTIDWLPTGNRLRLQGNIITECPRCKEEEDVDHLLICPQREIDNKGILENLKKYMEAIGTDQGIIEDMLYGMQRWLLPSAAEENNEITQIRYTQAYDEQSSIGWNLLARGFVANEWSKIQEKKYIEERSKKTGDGWSAKISEWWILTSHEAWTKRNSHLYEVSVNGETRCEQETFAQLRRLYEQQEEISAFDRKIFRIPIEERLKMHWRSVADWIEITAPVVKRLTTQFSEKILQGQTDIRQFGQITNPSQTEDNDNKPATNREVGRIENEHNVQVQTDIRSFFSIRKTISRIGQMTGAITTQPLGSNSSSRRLRQSISSQDDAL